MKQGTTNASSCCARYQTNIMFENENKNNFIYFDVLIVTRRIGVEFMINLLFFKNINKKKNNTFLKFCKFRIIFLLFDQEKNLRQSATPTQFAPIFNINSLFHSKQTSILSHFPFKTINFNAFFAQTNNQKHDKTHQKQRLIAHDIDRIVSVIQRLSIEIRRISDARRMNVRL